MENNFCMKTILQTISFCVFLLSFGTSKSQTIPSYVPPNGLVGWWPFNGNANDESGNGNNGTVYGPILCTDRFGTSNSAYSFNGTNNYIRISNNPSLNNKNVSISGWFNSKTLPINESNTVKGIVGKWWQAPSTCGRNYNSYLACLTKPANKNPALGFATAVYAGNTFTSESSIYTNNWYHFVIIHESGIGGKIYINGELQNFNTIGDTICNSINDVIIGADIETGMLYRYFDGKLDDIGIWNRALNQEEITKLFNASLSYETISLTDTLLFDDNNYNDNNVDELGVSFIRKKTFLLINKKNKFYTFNSDKRYGEWTGKSKNSFVNGEGTMKLYENDTLIEVSICSYSNGYKEGLSYDSFHSYVFSGYYKNGRKNGKGKIVYKDGAIYDGDWLNDNRHGRGKYVFQKYVYEGDWLNDKANGKGKIVSKDGNIYEGDWLNNNRHGKGKYVFKDGNIYEGDWLNDKANGKGKMLFKGHLYEGSFLNNNIHGKGKAVYKDGTVYEGDWLNNNRHGKGKVVYQDGEVYEGDWLYDNRHGKGKVVYQDGAVYEGDWFNNKRHGKGKFVNIDGAVYDGNWLNDKANGKGKMLFQGHLYEGYFLNNNQHGMGKIIYEDGDVYEGDWFNNNRHGKGKYVFKDGHVYEGDWSDGKQNGKGKFTYNDGTIYDGDWLSNKKHGNGIFIYVNGDYYEGVWRDDDLITKNYVYESKNSTGNPSITENKQTNVSKKSIDKFGEEIDLAIKEGLQDAVEKMRKLGASGGKMSLKDCIRCEGTGVVKVCPICYKRGHVHCKNCKGTGYNYNKACIECAGKGIVKCYSCRGSIYNIKCRHDVYQFQH